VKYIEKGSFPNTRRFFEVLRCNHCDDAPCVEICPTNALFRRPDGIVDFDGAACIGCDSCMQACPYDALYIDPETETAAKCNFCAHRVDVGLQPACVIACPTEAIVHGDLDDPNSRISILVAREPVRVRKPEKGTQPKLSYIDAEEVAITPTEAERRGTYAWGESRLKDVWPADEASLTKAITTYDVDHPKPWRWKVSSYLWTKSIAAGVLLIAGVLLLLGYASERVLLGTIAPGATLVFLGITTALLIGDLKQPKRFHYVLLRPNTDSWLFRGAIILGLYGLASLAWFAMGVLDMGFLTYDSITTGLLHITGPILGIATAVYSAYLFGQCDGRDFWQSPLLVWHLALAAVVAGSAVLLIGGWFVGSDSGALALLALVLLASVIVNLLVVLTDLQSHGTEDVRKAAMAIVRGRWRAPFWGIAVAVGGVFPALLLAAVLWRGFDLAFAAIAAILALVGLFVYEDIWIKAGQSVPLS